MLSSRDVPEPTPWSLTVRWKSWHELRMWPDGTWLKVSVLNAFCVRPARLTLPIENRVNPLLGQSTNMKALPTAPPVGMKTSIVMADGSVAVRMNGSLRSSVVPGFFIDTKNEHWVGVVLLLGAAASM